MNKKALLPILALIVAVFAGAYYLNDTQLNASEGHDTPEINVPPPPVPDNLSGIDVEAALQDRIIGDINAPIKISEHSSFTCGHCGNFHRRSFKAIKEQLIDTGKAYIVFSDFPLNAPALHASMIARCLPHDKYFDFVEMLFEDQEMWAYEADYIKFLQFKASEYGLDTKGIKACLNSDALRDGILAGMSAARTQWNINSTPSFVVNNKTTLSGALSPEVFIQKVNEAVKGE